MATRIYTISRKKSPAEAPTNTLPRLVRATSQAAAMRHVAAADYDIGVASQDELVDAMGAGVQVEDASQSPD